MLQDERVDHALVGLAAEGGEQLLALFTLVAQEGGGILAHLTGEILAHVLDLVLNEGGRVFECGPGDGGLQHRAAQLLLHLLVGPLAQLLGDPPAQIGERLELLRHLHREVVVRIRQLFLFHLVDRHLERDRLAGHLVVVPVFIDLDIDLMLHAGFDADQLLDQTRHADVLAFAQRELRARLVEDLFAVNDGAQVGGEAIVQLRRALDRLEHRVVAAQVEDPLLDRLLAVFAFGPGDGDPAVVAQLDGGRQRHGGPQGERLAAGDLHAGRRDRLETLALQRLLHGLRHHPLGGLLEDGVNAQRALHDGARRFALAEAGDAEALREPPRGLIQRAPHALLFELDLEQHLGFGDAFGSDFHSPTIRLSVVHARVRLSISARRILAPPIISRAG